MKSTFAKGLGTVSDMEVTKIMILPRKVRVSIECNGEEIRIE